MYQEWRRDRLCVSTDPSRLDVGAIHAFLTGSYWAEGIPRDSVERCLEHSLCFGVYEGKEQIGFARVVTDRATFAYLADVYVLPSHRGHGLASWLLSCLFSHADLQGLRRFHLVTRDAHELYGRFGFQSLGAPEWHMERVNLDVYKRL